MLRWAGSALRPESMRQLRLSQLPAPAHPASMSSATGLDASARSSIGAGVSEYRPLACPDHCRQIPERSIPDGRRRYVLGGKVSASTGASAPPPICHDLCVFDDRPSYTENTDAVVSYDPANLRKLQQRQIVVFAKHDSCVDAGLAGQGIPRTCRQRHAILRLDSPPNSVELDDVAPRLCSQRVPFKAVIRVATTRAAV